MDYRQIELTALAVEACRRGTSYGRLVAATTPEERREITRRWVEKKRRAVAISEDGPKRGRGEG